MLKWIALGIITLGSSFWLLSVIWWLYPYKIGIWLFHDKMKWHKPAEYIDFDGVNTHSKCCFCGKEIIEDSQGNWFKA